MKSRSIVVLAGLAITTAAPALAAPAVADNFGSTACGGNPMNCVSLGNNKWHAIRYDGSFGTNNWYDVPNMTTAMEDRLLYSFNNPTDLDAYSDMNDAYPDVVAADYDWGDNGLAGWAVCPSNNTGTGGNRTAGTGWCRGQGLRFNSWAYWHLTILDTWEARHYNACHELGHTVGLQHSGVWDSCMRAGAWTDVPRFLSSHDRDHINANY